MRLMPHGGTVGMLASLSFAVSRREMTPRGVFFGGTKGGARTQIVAFWFIMGMFRPFAES